MYWVKIKILLKRVKSKFQMTSLIKKTNPVCFILGVKDDLNFFDLHYVKNYDAVEFSIGDNKYFYYIDNKKYVHFFTPLFITEYTEVQDWNYTPQSPLNHYTKQKRKNCSGSIPW